MNRTGGSWRWSRWLLMLAPISVGVGAVGVAVANRQVPKQQPPSEVARPLRVVLVRRERVIPRVIGYGMAEPARVWRAVAEVGGRVVETHPALDAGTMVDAGALLVRIDPLDYELEVGRLEAEARVIEAQITEIDRGRMNDEKAIEIERESLALTARELSRYEDLYQRNSVTPSELERRKRDYLTQRRRVLDMENALALVPSKRDQASGNLAATRKRLESARRDLDRATIEAPLDGRLATVSIEVGQYVSPGETLFEIHGKERAEVEARLPLEDLQRLSPGRVSLGLGVLDSASELLQGLSATVRVRSGTWVREWPARLDRIREGVDRRTRSIGVVVAVDDPYGRERVDQVPLLDGTFCEVEFEGHPREGQLVVPRVAVRGGAVYKVDDEERLRRVPVRLVLGLADEVVVEGGIEAGDRIVVSDPTPAVEGMLVKPLSDETLSLAAGEDGG